MTARFGQLLGLDRAALAHGLRLAFAAWLAYAIASLLHVGNAYWAAMPVWVVAQSAKGLLIERGFFRFIGTLLGAAAGFGILERGPNPCLSLLLLGVWIACGTTLVHMLRGVHGYVHKRTHHYRLLLGSRDRHNEGEPPSGQREPSSLAV
jgi:uncharacterized membrane protein YccC